MPDRIRILSGLLGVLLLVACTPSNPASGTQPGPVPQQAQMQEKSLVIALASEPRGLGQLFTGGANTQAPVFMAVHDFLVRMNDQGQPVLALAAEAPTHGNATWQINPDGTQVTTWKLRSDVKWHDGTAFHPEDFVFSWKVALDPNVPYGTRRVPGLIDRMLAPDAQTLVIHWNGPYAFADRLDFADLYPLPRHLLENAYANDSRSVVDLQYWSSSFMGLGPYVLREWAPGSHVVVEARPDYYGGAPKIRTVEFRFINPNVLVANVLAGDIDFVVEDPSYEPSISILKQQWEAPGQGRVIANLVGNFRHVGIAMRTPLLQDLRLRQAFIHAMDRRTLAETLRGDANLMVDTWIYPAMEQYARARSSIRVYEYDTSRAAQLLQEAGFQGGPAAVVTPAGERLGVEFRGTPGLGEREASIICAGWRSLGVECQETIKAGPLAQDNEWRATYQWFDGTGAQPSMGFMGRRLGSTQIPTAETRWVGSSDGGIRDAEADRLISMYYTTAIGTEADRIEIELAALVSRELYIYPLFNDVRSMLARKGLQGPNPRAAVGGNGIPATWNIVNWDRE